MLNIKFSNISKKFLKKCDNIIYNRILKKIKELQQEPFPSNLKKIIGEEKVFRVRVGGHRILYEVYLNKNLILIVKIGKRPKVYD